MKPYVQLVRKHFATQLADSTKRVLHSNKIARNSISWDRLKK